MRALGAAAFTAAWISFPFLFGGTFIEGAPIVQKSEVNETFPFLFGGTFIEGCSSLIPARNEPLFPFLFGGTFIEG